MFNKSVQYSTTANFSDKKFERNKSLLCKTLSAHFYANKEQSVRFDMKVSLE